MNSKKWGIVNDNSFWTGDDDGMVQKYTDRYPHLVQLYYRRISNNSYTLLTVDRPRLAAALAREMDRAGRRPDCLVQVNTGAEPQKAGVAPEAADRFIADCREVYGLPVAGLMCVPPLGEEPALHFALLAEIAGRAGLARLSMGMSADFETAIRLGATHVRLGTAVFGPRG